MKMHKCLLGGWELNHIWCKTKPMFSSHTSSLLLRVSLAVDVFTVWTSIIAIRPHESFIRVYDQRVEDIVGTQLSENDELHLVPHTPPMALWRCDFNIECLT